jgi:hypothetical protein
VRGAFFRAISTYIRDRYIESISATKSQVFFDVIAAQEVSTMISDQDQQRAERRFKQEERARDGRKAMTEYETQARATRTKTERLKALRLAKEAQARIAPTAIANSCRQRYPTRVINFIQTRILITHHSCCRPVVTTPRTAVSVPLAQCGRGEILGYES